MNSTDPMPLTTISTLKSPPSVEGLLKTPKELLALWQDDLAMVILLTAARALAAKRLCGKQESEKSITLPREPK